MYMSYKGLEKMLCKIFILLQNNISFCITKHRKYKYNSKQREILYNYSIVIAISKESCIIYRITKTNVKVYVK